MSGSGILGATCRTRPMLFPLPSFRRATGYRNHALWSARTRSEPRPPFNKEGLVERALFLAYLDPSFCSAREFEPVTLPPRITFRTAINSFRVPNISCLLFSTIFGKMSRATWALDRMLHGPGASATVIPPRSQNQNRRNLFWNLEGDNRSSNLIVGSQTFGFELSTLG